MRLSRSSLVVIAISLVWGAARATAQPLADRVPSDALLYIGWSGAEHLAPAYAQSRLKGVIDASNVPELFSELGPRIVRRIQLEQMLQGDVVAKEVLPAILSLGETAWKKPVAIYFGPLDYSGKVPMPKVAVLCQAGNDAQAVTDTVNKLVAQIPPDVPIKIRVQTWPGDVVVVSTFDLNPKIEETLAQREQFQNAIKQGRPDPAVTVFFDAEKVLNVASLAINMAGDAKVTQTWQKILFTTGVAGIKRLVFTAGFDGKDWGTQAFIEAPQPRMGLLATLLDSTPVSDDLLKLAPQNSTWVTASRIDFARLFADVKGTAARFDPQIGRGIDDALREINQAIGFDVQKDLLASLGDQWMAFNSDQTGHGVLGMTLVSPLRNSAKVQTVLESLEKQANAAMAREAGDDGPKFSIETTQIDGMTVHYFAVPVVAPCWAIKNNTLYVALFPQILVSAAGQDATAGKSILTNDDFNAARKRLGLTNNAISLSYMDLPRLAPRGYQMVLALQRMGLGAADMFGLQTPAMVLPPLNKIMPHLVSSAGATWIDDAGWHYRGVTPFPGADLLGGEQALVATAAPLAVAVALPATARARQQAMMVQEASNLRQIGMGVMMYANDNKGDLPPDLGATYSYIQSPMVYIAAQNQGTKAVPPTARPEDLAKWVNENADYVYVGKDVADKLTKIPNTAQAIIAHEKFELSKNGMTNVLYADGHVELQPVQFVKQRVEQQKKPAGVGQ